MSYQKSQQTRQAILDYLHANPLKSANVIAVAIHKNRDTVQSCVKFMTARGEIEKTGQGTTTAYRALVVTTISAAEVIDSMQTKRKASVVKAATMNGKTESPGYYRQSGGGWKAQAHQGGQGALRREFGVVSGLA